MIFDNNSASVRPRTSVSKLGELRVKAGCTVGCAAGCTVLRDPKANLSRSDSFQFCCGTAGGKLQINLDDSRA